MLAIAASGLAASPTAACVSNVPTDPDDVEGDLVFIGTAVAQDLTLSEDARWTFAVDTVRHGRVGDRISVRTFKFEESCGAGFELGHRYVVGTSPPNWWVSNSGVVEVAALDNPPAVERPPPVDGIVATLLVVILVISALVIWRLRRHDSDGALPASQ